MVLVLMEMKQSKQASGRDSSAGAGTSSREIKTNGGNYGCMVKCITQED